MPNNDSFKKELERVLTAYAGEDVSVFDSSPISGGCISDARRLDTSAGPFFLKTNSAPLPQMFQKEAAGLQALHQTKSLTVPEPIAFGSGEGTIPPFLLTTWIESGRPTRQFFHDFGAQLAELHRHGISKQYGFHHDNFIGSTVQPNRWSDSWIDFFRTHRLGHQLQLAESNGYGGELQRLGNRLAERLDRILIEPKEGPALIHGDLWSGNYLVTAEGGPAIIDPAAYYGHREAELSIAKLFGGFSPDFFDAYQEAWPMEAGHEERLDIYKLYHLLNHLNLFGESYLGGSLDILKKFV